MAEPSSELTPVAASGGMSQNTAAALSYFTIIPAIIFLLVAPYDKNPYVRFHSLQSILFGFGAFAVQTLLFYLVRGGFLISLFISIGFFVLWLAVVVSAAQGKWFKIPVIGDFAMANSKG